MLESIDCLNNSSFGEDLYGVVNRLHFVGVVHGRLLQHESFRIQCQEAAAPRTPRDETKPADRASASALIPYCQQRASGLTLPMVN